MSERKLKDVNDALKTFRIFKNTGKTPEDAKEIKFSTLMTNVIEAFSLENLQSVKTVLVELFENQETIIDGAHYTIQRHGVVEK